MKLKELLTEAYNYKGLSADIKAELENAVSTDEYGLKPESLYKSIVGSLQGTPPAKVAELMNVSMTVINAAIENEDSLTESKLTKAKVDKAIKSLRDDNRENGEDAIEDGYDLADMFFDDEPEMETWLNDNGFDAKDYVASRIL